MSKVQLYIYDLTQGMAAQLSPLFLGMLITASKYSSFTNCDAVESV